MTGDLKGDAETPDPETTLPPLLFPTATRAIFSVLLRWWIVGYGVAGLRRRVVKGCGMFLFTPIERPVTLPAVRGVGETGRKRQIVGLVVYKSVFYKSRLSLAQVLT